VENVQLKDNSLLPCPFCGAINKPLMLTKNLWEIYCADCIAGITVTTYGTTESDVVKSWNTRAQPEAKDAWMDISTRPDGVETEPFFILVRNDYNDRVIMQVSAWENHMYPSHMGSNISFSDHIPNSHAEGWKPINIPIAKSIRKLPETKLQDKK